MPEVLSTDPNAGEVLSSDPNAGEPIAGFERALGGAETVGETPWYSREIPISRLLSLGVRGPEVIESNVPGVSVTKALRALPAVGGFVGGAIGGGAGTGVAPGPGTFFGAVKGAALGGATGEAARQLTARAIGVKAPETSMEAAKGIGKEAAIQGGAEAFGQGAGQLLRGGGKRLMHSALKPNPSLLREYKTTPDKLVKTLLDEGVNVTPGGIEKLQQLFNMTNKEIKELVKNAPGEINRNLVEAQAVPAAQRLAHQVNPQKALKDVAKTVERFREIPGPITIPEAQAMKVGTYQQIGKNYGKLSSASVETQKALARGLKEEIETAVPSIKALNAREAELMAAQDAVGHRVAIAGNRDPVGFAWVTNSPQTFLAALMDRSPVIKSMLARGMYSSAGKAAKVSPQLIRAAVLSLASDESASEPVRP